MFLERLFFNLKQSSPFVGWIVARLWASSPSVFLSPDCFARFASTTRQPFPELCSSCSRIPRVLNYFLKINQFSSYCIFVLFFPVYFCVNILQNQLLFVFYTAEGAAVPVTFNHFAYNALQHEELRKSLSFLPPCP